MFNIDLVANSNKLTNSSAIGKFILSMAMLLLCVIVDNIYINIGITIIVPILLINFAKIKGRFYYNLLKIPMIFIALSVVALLLTDVSSVDPDSIILKINLFDFSIGVTYVTLSLTLKVIIRSMGSISAVYFLILTTPTNQMIEIFKILKFPKEFIELYMLCYRFIFLLLDEINVIAMAQELRFGYKNIKLSYNSFSMLVAVVFRRTYDRYLSMQTSLDIKSYDGTFY